MREARTSGDSIRPRSGPICSQLASIRSRGPGGDRARPTDWVRSVGQDLARPGLASIRRREVVLPGIGFDPSPTIRPAPDWLRSVAEGPALPCDPEGRAGGPESARIGFDPSLRGWPGRETSSREKRSQPLGPIEHAPHGDKIAREGRVQTGFLKNLVGPKRPRDVKGVGVKVGVVDDARPGSGRLAGRGSGNDPCRRTAGGRRRRSPTGGGCRGVRGWPGPRRSNPR